MKKIPTLFRRDPDDMRRVLPEVTPGCEWVLAGEGVATRKYDGTCVLLSPSGNWWARREVKPGKDAPSGWIEVDHDEVTGKRVGWEPVEQSAFARWHADALDHVDEETLAPGTYELIGPKVNGNPEKWLHHALVPHDEAMPIPEVDAVVALWTSGVETLQFALGLLLRELPFEGVVWHHPDGRMAKLKARDFPAVTP